MQRLLTNKSFYMNAQDPTVNVLTKNIFLCIKCCEFISSSMTCPKCKKDEKAQEIFSSLNKKRMQRIKKDFIIYVDGYEFLLKKRDPEIFIKIFEKSIFNILKKMPDEFKDEIYDSILKLIDLYRKKMKETTNIASEGKIITNFIEKIRIREKKTWEKMLRLVRLQKEREKKND